MRGFRGMLSTVLIICLMSGIVGMPVALASDLCTFEGRIVNDGGDPISGVRVWIADLEDKERIEEIEEVRSDVHGQWAIEAPKGEYWFFFSSADYRIERQRYAYGGERDDIVDTGLQQGVRKESAADATTTTGTTAVSNGEFKDDSIAGTGTPGTDQPVIERTRTDNTAGDNEETDTIDEDSGNEPQEEYDPTIEPPAAPTITRLDLVLTSDDMFITWTEVPDATYYLFSFISADGLLEVYDREWVEDTRFEVDPELLDPTKTYIASVVAVIHPAGKMAVEGEAAHWMYYEYLGTGEEEIEIDDDAQWTVASFTQGRRNSILSNNQDDNADGTSDIDSPGNEGMQPFIGQARFPNLTTDEGNIADSNATADEGTDGTPDDPESTPDGQGADGTDGTPDDPENTPDGQGADGTDGTPDDPENTPDGQGTDGTDGTPDDPENTPDGQGADGADGGFVDDADPSARLAINRTVDFDTLAAGDIDARDIGTVDANGASLTLSEIPGTRDIGSGVTANYAWTGTAPAPVTYDLHYGKVQIKSDENILALPVVEADKTGLSITHTIAIGSLIGNYTMYVEAKAAENVISNAVHFPVVDPDFTQIPGWVKSDNTRIYWDANIGSTVVANNLAAGTAVLILGSFNSFYYVRVGLSTYGFIQAADILLEDPSNYSKPTNLRVTAPTAASPYTQIEWAAGDTRGPRYEVSIYRGMELLASHILPSNAISYNYTGELAYNTAYRITVRAIPKSTSDPLGPSEPVETTFTTGPAPDVTSTPPALVGDITYGFLEHNNSMIQWAEVAGATRYEWYVISDTEYLHSDTAGTSISWTDLIGLADGTTYTLKIRTWANMGSSAWRTYTFTLIPRGTPYVYDFAMATRAEVGKNFTMNLVGVNIPTGSLTVRVYIEKAGNSNNGYLDLTAVNGVITHSFLYEGTYTMHVMNSYFYAGLPDSPKHTIVIAEPVVTPTIPVITAITNPQTKGKTFKINWSSSGAGAIYTIGINSLDGKVSISAGNLTANSYDVPADKLTRIGPYTVFVTAQIGDVFITSAAVSFDLVDGAYTAASGKVKTAKDNYETYMTPATSYYSGISIPKGTSVSIVGELDKFYHLKYSYTPAGASAATTVYVFIPTDSVTKSSSGGSSGGGGGGSGGGGSSGGGTSGGTISSSGGTFTVTAYKAAFGSESDRKASYAYIEGLYEPLAEMIRNNEVAAKTQLSLLTTSFSPMPDELNSNIYTDARTRAAWSLVSAFMYYLGAEAATDDVIAQQNALQSIAGSLASTIDELLAQNKTLDEASKEVLQQVLASAQSVAASTTSASLGADRHEVVVAVLGQIMNGMPYNEDAFTAVRDAFVGVAPDEPLEVRFMRVLYALSQLMEGKLTVAISELPDEKAAKEDVDTVQNAYLNYVFAVAKLHNMSYAIAKAPAEVVVQNWGAEITRLIAVNKVYNEYK